MIFVSRNDEYDKRMMTKVIFPYSAMTFLRV